MLGAASCSETPALCCNDDALIWAAALPAGLCILGRCGDANAARSSKEMAGGFGTQKFGAWVGIRGSSIAIPAASNGHAFCCLISRTGSASVRLHILNAWMEQSGMAA